MPSGTDIMHHSDLILRPDPARTVLRPFDLVDPEGYGNQGRSRMQRIADRVLALDDEAFEREFSRVSNSLAERHRDVKKVMARRFAEVKVEADCAAVEGDRALLVGGYFLQEYAFEAAALFNPSMVLHPDQSNLKDGQVRFALSLRGIGEGHLSSVTFRVGTWGPDEGFVVEDASPIASTPRIDKGSADDDGGVQVTCEDSTNVSESVLFPITPSQSRGIEDMRLVLLREDDGTQRALGTYTAYNGSDARVELMEAEDYNTFTLRKMTGSAAKAKGIAIFPRRINGRYAALGRQDSENIWFLTSDSLTHWDGGEKVICPKYFWEYVQMGNCGSPIEIEEGWLVLTHGVGSVRNYCIGVALLDRDDPTKVLGRRPLPLVHPSPKERDGYVPNVVYSCGGMVHDRTLLLPYGVADNFTAFAHVALDDLLATLD